MGSVPKGLQQGRHGVYVFIRHGGKVVQFLFDGLNFLLPVQRFSAVGIQKKEVMVLVSVPTNPMPVSIRNTARNLPEVVTG